MSGGPPAGILGCASYSDATFWVSGALPDKANKEVGREH